MGTAVASAPLDASLSSRVKVETGTVASGYQDLSAMLHPVARSGNKCGRRNQKQSQKLMPVLAKFYGIVIRLLCVRSLGARLHAFYGDSELVIHLDTLRVIQGDVPQRVTELVLEWARAHYQELLADSARVFSGLRPLPIAPLA